MIGGLISLILGISLPWIFPDFYLIGEEFVLTFQTVLIIGGILTIVGAILYIADIPYSSIFIVIGGLLGGVNIITLWGLRLIREDESPAVRKQIQSIVGKTEEDKIRWAKTQFENGMSLRDIANILIKNLARDELHPEIVSKSREGDIRHCYADISKIKEKLGYEPGVEYEDGILDLVDWVKEEEAVDRFEESQRELERKGLTL